MQYESPTYVSRSKLASEPDIWINAFHGTGNVSRTNWVLEACHSIDVALCDTQAMWSAVTSGSAAVYEAPVARLHDLISDQGVCSGLTLRLTASIAGEADRTLTRIVRLKYGPNDIDPNTLVPVNGSGLPLGDLNEDGIVSEADRPLFEALMAMGGLRPRADLNSDGALNELDRILFDSYMGNVAPGAYGIPSCHFN
jgi:hypothetical protein